MIVRREVITRTGASEAYDYLSDFTTTNEWDPGTVRTERVEGDGGVGTVYRNTSSFAGRTTELTYVVTELRAPELIALRGENASLVALDTMTLEPTAGGTRVVYQADFRFKGVWRLVAPFLRPAFRRLGDEAQAGLKAALDRR